MKETEDNTNEYFEENKYMDTVINTLYITYSYRFF
jgi:hypothetical protein